jgi:RNA polymerase sigma-70 factor (ECF subfamily)
MPDFSGTSALPTVITPRMRRPDNDGGPAEAGHYGVSDASLMERTAAGDREAFAALYRRHGATVYRFARLMTGCPAAAEDIVQEAFLSLMREAARYDAGRASLTTYLYGVARNQTRRRLLRDRRFVALDDDEGPRATQEAAADVTQALEQQDDLNRLRRAVLALPSRYREVIVMCELQDVSYADAATALGCPLGTVRSRLHRAKALLGEKMQRAGRAEEPAMRCAI